MMSRLVPARQRAHADGSGTQGAVLRELIEPDRPETTEDRHYGTGRLRATAFPAGSPLCAEGVVDVDGDRFGDLLDIGLSEASPTRAKLSRSSSAMFSWSRIKSSGVVPTTPTVAPGPHRLPACQLSCRSLLVDRYGCPTSSASGRSRCGTAPRSGSASTLLSVLDEPDAAVRALVERLHSEPPAPDDVDEGDRWAPLLQDVMERFGPLGVLAVGPGSVALDVTLAEQNATLERRLRARYGEGIIVEYGRIIPTRS